MHVLKRTALLVLSLATGIWLTNILIANNLSNGSTAQLQLPYKVAETGIVIERIMNYDGPFFEDRSQNQVTDIAAAVLYNCSENLLESFVITIETELNSYRFEGTMIPAGAKVIVLEAEKKQWVEADLVQCGGFSKAYTDQGYSCICADVIQDHSGDLKIINRSENTIASVFVYQKYWSEEFDAYLGGFTWKTVIKDLQAGDILAVKTDMRQLEEAELVLIA